MVNTDQGQAQFDRTVAFTTRLSSDQVVDVYRTLLPRLGWRVIYAGPGAGRRGPGDRGPGQEGSGDGFYWEVGAVVSPTTSAGTTPFSLELFELPDEQLTPATVGTGRSAADRGGGPVPPGTAGSSDRRSIQAQTNRLIG